MGKTESLKSETSWMGPTCRLFLGALRLIPFRLMAPSLSWLFGVWGTRFGKKHRAVIQAQSALALGAENELSPKQVFASLGFSIAEAIHIPYLVKNADFEIDGGTQEILEAGKDRGSMVLGAHLACFELLAAYFSNRGLDLFVVGRKPNYQLLDHFITSVRETPTIWREDKRATHKLLKAFRGNSTVASLIDQDTKLDSVYGKFFFAEAAAPSGLLNLAVKTDKPLFSCLLTRNFESKESFKISVRKLDSKAPAGISLLTHCLAQYNAHLEDVIRANPEQWVWWHRRWRHRPEIDYTSEPEKLGSTNQYLSWLEQQKH